MPPTVTALISGATSEFGFAALFLSALGAATVLPGSSEVVLVAMALSGVADRWALLIVATTGNVLGSLINWCMGRGVARWRERPWFPLSPSQHERVATLFNRFGWPSLLFAWLPVIGDPLTVVAGMSRMPVMPFLVLVAAGKAGRYAVILALLL